MKGIVYNNPNLLQLPESYGDLFSYFSQKACKYCNLATKESAVCLLCGSHLHISCFDSIQNHSENCTTINLLILDINTTLVNIIRDTLYATWSSLYLDEHGEQDPYLMYILN